MPQLPRGAGAVAIDMTGSWRIEEALPVAYSASSQLDGPKGATFAAESGGNDTLQRFLSLLQIGARLEIREDRFDSAGGLLLDQGSVSSPDRVLERYVNQTSKRFALYHVISKAKPELESNASLTLWLVTGAVDTNRMVGRVTLQAEEDPVDLEFDWWVGLVRIDS